MDNILVPVSPGEVLDKLTILEIKSERMNDPGQVANVRRELDLLRRSWSAAVTEDDTVRALRAELRAINEALWDIEDAIRDKERAREFDERFIELARAVYVTNDRRSAVKKKLNLHLGSQIVEEKSYRDYC
jgi:transcriptional regulator of nitric oxide reductase